MTFEVIRALSDEEALLAINACVPIVKGAGIHWRQFESGGVLYTGNLTGDLAMRLEEKLRERFPYFSFTYDRARDVTEVEASGIDTAHNFYYEWPASVSPCRVRVDAFLRAFGRKP